MWETWLSLAPRALLAFIPWTFAAASLRWGRTGPEDGPAALRRVERAGAGTVVLTVLAAALHAVGSGASAATGAAAWLRDVVHVDGLGLVMLLLVGGLGVVVARFSRTYLRAEPGLDRYGAALGATLTAVTVLLIANHLLVIGAAWMAISFSLHRLLTFYAERPQALGVARQKFLLGRAADLCLAGALLVLGSAAGSLQLDAVNAWATAQPTLPQPGQLALVLVVLSVLLRSAQVPFHAWMTRVMEAPTPVSALLHAGVVNIGAFVLMRLAPALDRAPIAQSVLVVVGLVSACLGALAMMTRASVKVGLAWSTIAQMGFLLVQCGLGLWSLAFLHLVAHSLYKAHAFLNAGSVVDRWRGLTLTEPQRDPNAAGGGVVMGGVAAIVLAVCAGGVMGFDPRAHLLPAVLALGCLTLLMRSMQERGRARVALLFTAVGLVVLSTALHAVVARALPAGAGPPPPAALPWIVMVGLVGLFVVQLVLQRSPQSTAARAIRRRLMGELAFDAPLQRLAHLVWRPASPLRDRRSFRAAAPQEARP